MQKDFKNDFRSGPRDSPRDGPRSDFRKKAFDKARRGVAEAFSKKDASLIQATRALDDLDGVKSLMSQRLAEWVGANYPEYRLQNDENTARVYALCGSKEEFAKNEAKLAEIVGAPKAAELAEGAKASYGVEFTKTERDAVRTLAALTAAVYAERTVLQEFVEETARENARNISTLIEPLLAARLISLAGGMEKLAKMPASTIQVIGAEKALFKHLRMGTQPPKHGLIFQSPLINGAPLHQRGKIARALATKLSIASKADWFTGNFIAEKLKATLDARLTQIRGLPEPSEEKKRELRANEQRRQADRQRDWQNSRSQRSQRDQRGPPRNNSPRGSFGGDGSGPKRFERKRDDFAPRAAAPSAAAPRSAPYAAAPHGEQGGFRSTVERTEQSAERNEERLERKDFRQRGGERRDFGPSGNNYNREFRKRDGERRDYAAGGSRKRGEFGHGERTPGGERGGFEHQKRGGFNKFRKFNKFKR